MDELILQLTDPVWLVTSVVFGIVISVVGQAAYHALTRGLESGSRRLNERAGAWLERNKRLRASFSDDAVKRVEYRVMALESIIFGMLFGFTAGIALSIAIAIRHGFAFWFFLIFGLVSGAQCLTSGWTYLTYSAALRVRDEEGGDGE